MENKSDVTNCLATGHQLIGRSHKTSVVILTPDQKPSAAIGSSINSGSQGQNRPWMPICVDYPPLYTHPYWSAVPKRIWLWRGHLQCVTKSVIMSLTLNRTRPGLGMFFASYQLPPPRIDSCLVRRINWINLLLILIPLNRFNPKASGKHFFNWLMVA